MEKIKNIIKDKPFYVQILILTAISVLILFTADGCAVSDTGFVFDLPPISFER